LKVQYEISILILITGSVKTPYCINAECFGESGKLNDYKWVLETPYDIRNDAMISSKDIKQTLLQIVGDLQ
jgi:hypothetical protein